METDQFTEKDIGFVILKGKLSWVWKSRFGRRWYEPVNGVLAVILAVMIFTYLSSTLASSVPA